ncbi:alpha/beta hydrolase-fold protein [Ekhidna sp.]
MIKTAISTIVLGLVSITVSFAQNNGVKDDSLKAYEMPRTQVITINNSETKAQDVLYVKLPEGYAENSDMVYPVLYFTHPVQHIEILSAASETLIEDVILVGVTFQKGMTFRTVDSYMNFIRNDVFKTIENSYRADADRRTYFGYSSGALVGAYILSKHPNAFKNFILGSPALGGDSTVTQQIYEFGSTANGQKELNANVFVSYGESEKEVDKQHFEEFITLLKNLKDESLTFKHIVVEGDHRTSFPMTAIQGVTWLADLIKDSDPPTTESPYFGQKPPGLIPEVFAPDIVSIDGRFEGAISFTPDLDELYLGANDENEETHIYHSKLVDTQWTPLERINFTKEEADEELHPFVSPDGERIFFTVLDSGAGPEIWYVNRLVNGWSEAIKLDSPINDDPVFYPNHAKNGNLYYFNLAKMKTYVAINQNGEFPEVEEVDIAFGNHAFISPSQDYLVMTARTKVEGRTDNDVFVCFKESNGSWADAINLGSAVNSGLNEKSPSISPDGKYLFFGRAEREGKIGLSNIHWVSTEIIEQVRPTD